MESEKSTREIVCEFNVEKSRAAAEVAAHLSMNANHLHQDVVVAAREYLVVYFRDAAYYCPHSADHGVQAIEGRQG